VFINRRQRPRFAAEQPDASRHAHTARRLARGAVGVCESGWDSAGSCTPPDKRAASALLCTLLALCWPT